MKIKTLALALAVSTAMAGLTTATANAATPVVNGDGILTGAKSVAIGNNLYDVEFRDGTCAQVYGACTNASFDFKLLSDAGEAAAALVSQVFVDGPLGDFDSNPGLTFGCTGTVCNTFITYASTGVFSFSSGIATNRDVDLDSFTTASRSVQLNSASLSDVNFARFTFMGTVPEPATWAMMLVGFGMIGAATRYRRKGVQVRYA